MKFMVQLQLRPGTKNQAVEAFEQRGPNRNPGVTFRGAWIGAHSDVVFAIVESAAENLVSEAAKSLEAFGACQITPVLDIDQY